MKRIIFTWLLSVAFITVSSSQYALERTGYEGDHFSLEGAVDLFKQSYSIKDFERKLNSRDSWVNNLDLDYDGRIDYIRVEHRRQGDYHAIILQVPIDRYDIQDIAVIEIEKVGRRRAMLQIIGDEDIYGEEVIVEAYEDEYYGSSSRYNDNYVNVYYWRAVQSIFDRNYRVYVSPYRWHYYPTWWNPWNQYSWNVYRPYRIRHRRYCRVVNIHRVVHVHHFYKPHRSYSNHVVTHTNKVRVKHGKPAINRTNNRKGKADRGTYVGSRKNSQRPNNSGVRNGNYNDNKVGNRSSNKRDDARPNIGRESNKRSTYGSKSNASERNNRSGGKMGDTRQGNNKDRKTFSNNKKKAPKTNKPSRSFGNKDKKSSSSRKVKPQKRDYGQEKSTRSSKKWDNKPSSSPKRSAPKAQKKQKVKMNQRSRPSAKKQKAPSRKTQAKRSAPSPKKKVSKSRRGM